MWAVILPVRREPILLLGRLAARIPAPLHRPVRIGRHSSFRLPENPRVLLLHPTACSYIRIAPLEPFETAARGSNDRNSSTSHGSDAGFGELLMPSAPIPIILRRTARPAGFENGRL